MSTVIAIVVVVCSLGMLITYQLGYSVGRRDGFQEGFEHGKESGEADGLKVGYDRGRHDRIAEESDSSEENRAGCVWGVLITLIATFTFCLALTGFVAIARQIAFLHVPY